MNKNYSEEKYENWCLRFSFNYILLFARAIYFSYFIKLDKCVMIVTHVLLYLQPTNVRSVSNKFCKIHSRTICFHFSFLFNTEYSILWRNSLHLLVSSLYIVGCCNKLDFVIKCEYKHWIKVSIVFLFIISTTLSTCNLIFILKCYKK